MIRSKFLILFILLLWSVGSYAQGYDTKLIPYRSGDKWGYCDAQKKIIIQPQFKEAFLFQGLLATARLDSFYCVINQKGKILYKTRSYIAICMNGKYFIAGENYYSAQVFDTAGNPLTQVYDKIIQVEHGYFRVAGPRVRYGLLDSTLKEVLSPKYESIEFFSNDLVKVYDRENRYGLVDLRTGKQFATGYSMIYPPHEGLIMVRKDDLYGFINMAGDVVIPVRYGKECPWDVKRGQNYNEYGYEGYNYDGFYGGLAVVLGGDKAGYIDHTGNVAIPFEFDKAFGFIGNYAWVQKDGKWGMINRQGKYVLQPLYKHPAYVSAKELMVLDGFHEGLISVSVDSLYGYVDTTGKIVLPFTYTRAEAFHDGIAAVSVGGKYGIMNRKGEWIIKPRYKWIEGAGVANGSLFIDGCAIVLGDDDMWGIIDKKGNRLMQVRFVEPPWFEHGIANGATDEKRYFFNTKGQILYTFDTEAGVSHYGGDLFMNYRDKYYFNAKTKVKYCD